MRIVLGHKVFDVWAEGAQPAGRNRSRGSVFFENDMIYSYGFHFTLAVRQPWGFLMNGDTHSPTTSKHQAEIRLAIRRTGRPSVTVPFSALHAASISPLSISLVDTEGDRELPVACRRGYCAEPKPHTHGVHLLGRSVILSQNAREPTTYYLSGTDETMTDPWRGYFLAQLPRPANSVPDALKALQPLAVLQAKENGIPVKRQGEWFFIPAVAAPPGFTAAPHGLISEFGVYLGHRSLGRQPRHRVTEYRIDADGQRYVRGTVRHVEREHKMLSLGKQWYTVHENLEVRSFRIAGRVD